MQFSKFVDHWPYNVNTLQAKGISAYCFLVEGDADRMREYCQRYFTVPSKNAVQLEPISPYVVVQFTHTEHMGGPDNSYPDIGSQNEISLVFFAKNNGENGHDEVFAVAPYIVVDNPMSAIQAREAFGLPKEVGEFLPAVPPLDADEPTHLCARVMGVPDPAALEARFDWYSFVEVERVSDAQHNLMGLLHQVSSLFENPLQDLEDVGAALATALGEGVLGATLLPALLAGHLRTVSLKEFKDVSSSLNACYQSIVATAMHIQHPGGFRHLNGTYQLRFSDLGTHPIRGDLGLVGVRPAKLSFAMSYDLDLGGAEL